VLDAQGGVGVIGHGAHKKLAPGNVGSATPVDWFDE
jgi:hypothetical protein